MIPTNLKRKRALTAESSSKGAEATISALVSRDNAPKKQKPPHSQSKVEEVAGSASHSAMDSISKEPAQDASLIIQPDDDDNSDGWTERELRQRVNQLPAKKIGNTQEQQQRPRVQLRFTGVECCVCREWVSERWKECKSCDHEPCEECINTGLDRD